MNIASSDLISILIAMVWLIIGIIVLWYANHITTRDKRFAKVLSFWGLSLLVNAALSVYIPDATMALILCGMIFIIGCICLMVVKLKK